MNHSIKTKQLTFSVFTFILASSLLTSFLYSFAGNDSWVSVIIGYVASLVIIGIYVALAKRYPGCSLIEINDAVFGRIAGKAVSLCYIFYFFSIAVLNTRNLGDFTKSALLANTPISVIFVLFIFLCAYAVKKGPVKLNRFGTIFAFLTIAAILFNYSLLFNLTKPKFLLPALTHQMKNYLIGAHIVTMIPFCEIVIFMMFLPYMEQPGEFGKAIRNGLKLGACTLIFIVLRDITVLGEFVAILAFPTFSVIQLINIGDILTRLEIIYAIVLITILFYKVSLIYMATVDGIGRLFKFQSYEFLVHITGALIILYSMAIFKSSIEHIRWGQTAASTYSTFFILILPMTTLIISLIRGLPKRNNSTVSENSTP
jgi:spore germination protein KB